MCITPVLSATPYRTVYCIREIVSARMDYLLSRPLFCISGNAVICPGVQLMNSLGLFIKLG